MSAYADLEELKRIAAAVVETARTKGADTAVARVQQKSHFEVEVRNGDIENLAEADSHSFGLTLSKDGKRASVTSSDVTRDSLNLLIDQALTMCKYTDSDSFYTLPDPELQAQEVADLDLYDPRIVAIDVAEKIEKVQALEQALKAQDPRLRSDGAAMSTAVAASAIANSNGFCQANTMSMVDMSAGAFAEDQVSVGDLNSGRKQTGSWVSRAHHLEDLEDIQSVAERAAHRVLRKLGGRKPQTGRFPVYFEPQTARSLWIHLVQAIRGGEVYRGESYLAGRLGDTIAAPEINVIDDPTLRRGLGSRPYDDEGVRVSKRPVVSNGVLDTYLLSTYSANKLGMKTTGNAGGPSNLIVQPGTHSEQDMLKQMDCGVWVIQMLGSGYNISTGDYSRGALGLWVENGHVQYPIMEFTLNSSLEHIYKNIVLLGNNTYTGSAIQTPGLVVADITISGS